MKKIELKSAVGMIIMSLFFIAFIPSNVSAQNAKKQIRKSKKATAKNNREAAKINARIIAAPRHARVVRYNNIDYRFHNGIYYRPVNGGYIVSDAPVGMRVSVLPRGYTRVRKHGADYYYVGKTYYKPIHQNRGEIVYEVVRA